jgi:hypothetical protein
MLVIWNLGHVIVGFRESSVVPICTACVCQGKGHVLDVAADPRGHLTIIRGRYSPKRICSVDETRLFWKRMRRCHPRHCNLWYLSFIKIYGKHI